MTASWLPWSLLAAALWGVWAFFSKLALRGAAPIVVLVYFLVGQAAVILAAAAWARPLPGPAPTSAGFSVASGVAAMLAALAFLTALRRAPASIVVPLTALYPLVAIALGILVLRERLTAPQAAGALLAVVAVVLLSL